MVDFVFSQFASLCWVWVCLYKYVLFCGCLDLCLCLFLNLFRFCWLVRAVFVVVV